MTSSNSPSLPYPVSARRRPSMGSYRDIKEHPSTASRLSLAFLVEQVRTSSWAVLILGGFSILSVLINLRLLLSDSFRAPLATHKIPLSISATLSGSHAELSHLVMVPGHAIYKGCDASHAMGDTDWILEPYQRDGTVKTLIKHLTKGAEIAVQDPHALLIFSGGQTRRNADLTESMSYAKLAKAGNIYQQFKARDAGYQPDVEFDRVTTENFALDSYQNLLFSIARFKEYVGHYPTKITIVGFEMKRQRFEDIHRAALRWPIEAFRYVGIDNEQFSQAAYDGERASGLQPYSQDSYGCKGVLLAKRKSRNPYRRYHSYHSSAPELEQLMEYCPNDNELFSGPLPWAP